MPPPDSALPAVMSNHRGTGLHFLLGTEYEEKNQKLQEELQMDYKSYINQKGNLKAGVYHKSQSHGLSLPIAERTSEKEKLREERKREYNLFLKEQAKTRRRGQVDVPSKPEGPYDFDKVDKYNDHSPNESNKLAQPTTSRKDAATLTDIIRRKNSRKTWDLSHRRDFPSRQESSSDEKFNRDSEEEMEFSHRKKPNGQIHMSKYIKEDCRAKRAPHITAKEAMAERPIPNSTAATAAARGFATGLLIGHSEEQDTLQKKKEQYKQALLSQIAEQCENKRKEKILELQVAATGANDPHRPGIFKQFGPEYRTYEKWKKGVYSKSETGVTAAKDNPELKHFPDSNIRMEHRELPGRPNIAFSSPTRDDHRATKSGAGHRNYSPDTSVEEYKSSSQMIGDLTAKMVSPVPPPLPPRVDHIFKTPHDEAYNYYGSRHPLEPILSYNQNNITSENIYKPEGPQEFEGSTPPEQRPTKHRPRPTQPDFGQKITVIPLRDPSLENERQRKKNYQEALRQQVKDKAEHRRREKEERELYEAKKVSEMMAYNPWGRAGGGAPLIDQNGNLITDLDQMHKLNEEIYRNCNLNIFGLSRAGSPQVKSLPGMEQLGYKEPENLQRQDHYKESLKQQIEENRRKQAEEKERQKILEEKEEKRLVEERARIRKEYEEEAQRNKRKMQRKRDDELWAESNGKSVTDKHDNGKHSLESETEDRPPTREGTARTTQRGPQQSRRGYNGPNQDQYKELLEQQVEENRRKKTEEKERQKILEEKEEKRLAEQRAHIQKEYEEEEQRNRRKMQNKQDYKQQTYDGKAGDQEQNITGNGPLSLITPFQHKPTNTNVPSPPVVTCQLSSKTDHLEAAPHKHLEQVLVKTQQLPDNQQVITELGTLRRILEEKKKHLETKLIRTDPLNKPSSRHQRQVRQTRGDAAERAHRENVQFPMGKHHPSQNIREFNQLKYRDTSSRKELLHNYPDPPNDGPGLDIQQQALLREQQRRLGRMKRRDMEQNYMDFLDEQEDLPSNRNLSNERVKSLPADSLFLDVYSCEEDLPHLSSEGSLQSSSHPRRHDYDKEAVHVDQMDHFEPDAPPHVDQMDHFEPDAPPRSSDTIVNQVKRHRHKPPSEHQCGDEEDLLSVRSSRFAWERPVSVGTVATEPWLQKTSELEHSGYRRPGRRPQAHI